MTEVTPKRPKENTERSTVSNSDGFAMMTGAIPIDDIDSGRDSWCQTARPLELTEDEDRMKTPTGKKTETDFSNAESKGLNSKNNTSDLQRQPSLSRSMSTPEMQDLSFLPTLKHQALTRPPGRAVRRFELRHRGLYGESVAEPRFQPGPGVRQIALNERDTCHATQIYIRRLRCKWSILYLRGPGCNTLAG